MDGLGAQGAPLELADKEMELLREITSGSDEREAGEEEVAALLSKLGVASETQAIEYAIKAGITWQ